MRESPADAGQPGARTQSQMRTVGVPDASDPRVAMAVTEDARRVFWEEMAIVAPDVLLYLFDVRVFKKMTGNWLPPDFVGATREKRAIDHVSRWCDHHNINSPLLVQDARSAFDESHWLWLLTNGQEMLESVNVPTHKGVRFVETPRALTTFLPLKVDLTNEATEATFIAWDPITERRQNAEERIMRQFAEHLRQAMGERAAAYCGLPTLDLVIEKRENRHFKWLIRAQVLRESRTAIANDEGADRGWVGKAIDDLAQMLWLIPRRDKGGRPKNPERDPPRTVKVAPKKPVE